MYGNVNLCLIIFYSFEVLIGINPIRTLNRAEFCSTNNSSYAIYYIFLVHIYYKVNCIYNKRNIYKVNKSVTHPAIFQSYLRVFLSLSQRQCLHREYVRYILDFCRHRFSCGHKCDVIADIIYIFSDIIKNFIIWSGICPIIAKLIIT